MPQDENGREHATLAMAATVYHVNEKRKDRKVEDCVRKDGDPQKPSKRPRERFTRFRDDEFSQLQAGRKKSNDRRDHLWLDGHGDGQREKTSDKAKPGEEKETKKLALGHRCRF